MDFLLSGQSIKKRADSHKRDDSRKRSSQNRGGFTPILTRQHPLKRSILRERVKERQRASGETARSEPSGTELRIPSGDFSRVDILTAPPSGQKTAKRRKGGWRLADFPSFGRRRGSGSVPGSRGGIFGDALRNRDSNPLMELFARILPETDPGFAKPRVFILTASAVMSLLFVFLALFLLIGAAGKAGFPLPSAGFPRAGREPGIDILGILENAPADESDDEAATADLPLTLTVGTHRISPGETLDSIAKRYGLRRDTLISINGIIDVRRLRSGDSLKIPNIDGIVCSVRSGDSLGSVASRYHTDLAAILDANNLETAQVHKGEVLFIPGARLEQSDLKRAMGTLFAWPVRGAITSPFGYRVDPIAFVRRFHAGVDIRANEGNSIRATMAGRVVETGVNANFGNYVIIAHSDGYQSAYCHMSKITSREGKRVDQGEKIGEVGTTGYSTGPHLHFALYRRGKAINPLNYLAK